MFSKNKKSKILSITFTLIFAILISNAIFWQSFIIAEFNKRLSSNGFKIISAKISGNLLSSIKIKEVNVIHSIYGDLSINKSVVNLDFFSSIFGRLTFDYISIEDLITASLNNALNKSQPIKKHPRVLFVFVRRGSVMSEGQARRKWLRTRRLHGVNEHSEATSNNAWPSAIASISKGRGREWCPQPA